MRRLLAVLVAALVAWLGLVQPATAVPGPTAPMATYAYYDHGHASPVTYTTTERGPPASHGHAVTTYNAIDLRSGGSSACSGAATPAAAFAYDPTAPLVQFARTSGTAEGQSRVIDGDVSPFQRVGVAAKTGDEAFHYTSSKWLDGIMSGGLREGTYATPDGSLSPLQATLDLALPPNRALPNATLRIDLAGLRKAGYEIPTPSRVSSTVTGSGGRVYNMPGGGYEMQFPYEIPPQFLSVVPR